jgi:hypothetical protein
MKTAREVLLEIVHLKDASQSAETAQILQLFADLARVVAELEEGHGPAAGASSHGRSEADSAPVVAIGNSGAPDAAR